jgi:hypothetical protein
MKSREGSIQCTGKVGRVVQRDEYVGGGRRVSEKRTECWHIGTGQKASEDPEAEKWKKIYALVVVVMLKDVSESCRTLDGAPEWETY